jgi:hypothetical protein
MAALSSGRTPTPHWQSAKQASNKQALQLRKMTRHNDKPVFGAAAGVTLQ